MARGPTAYGALRPAPWGRGHPEEVWLCHHALASVVRLGVHRCPGDPLIPSGQQVLILESGPLYPICWEGEKS